MKTTANAEDTLRLANEELERRARLAGECTCSGNCCQGRTCTCGCSDTNTTKSPMLSWALYAVLAWAVVYAIFQGLRAAWRLL